VHVFGQKAGLPTLAATNVITDINTQKEAEAILKQTGVKKGFCLVLGGGDGKLALELAKQSELIVFGVDADAAKVAAGREWLLQSGLYGPRVTLDHIDLSLIPYSSYFANLIVG
jgi:cyclopropane fatty-acyl-phospholipid synthase-like methyltransferase